VPSRQLTLILDPVTIFDVILLLIVIVFAVRLLKVITVFAAIPTPVTACPTSIVATLLKLRTLVLAFAVVVVK
jgi:hypothetical protein